MDQDVSIEYFTRHQKSGQRLKVYLDNKTMLSGKITAVDSKSVVLDKCLIFVSKIISSTPDTE